MQSADSYKTISLPNGEVLAYREAGDPANKTLILVHGNLSSSRAWDKTIPRLQDKLRVIAVDVRGYGDSSYNTPVKSLADFAEDLKLFCDALRLSKVSLMGWSLGGGISLQFACKYPEYVEKVILHCSVGIKGFYFPKLDENYQPKKERILTDEEIRTFSTCTFGAQALRNKDPNFVKMLYETACFGDFKPTQELLDNAAEYGLKQNLDCWFDSACAMNKFNISNESNELGPGTNDVANLKAPVLILAGEKDKIIPLAEQEFIKKELGDKAELKVYPGVGHSLCDEKPDEFIKDVREFLL